MSANPDVERFAIISGARSGSNMLRSLLESHPGVECLGEIFNPNYGAGYARWRQKSSVRKLRHRYLRDHCVELYLDTLFNVPASKSSLRAKGFKVMYPGQYNRLLAASVLLAGA